MRSQPFVGERVHGAGGASSCGTTYHVHCRHIAGRGVERRMEARVSWSSSCAHRASSTPLGFGRESSALVLV